MRLYLLWCAECIPKRVDFVEHHHPGFDAIALGDQVFAPDGQVGFGDARVCRQNKYDGMRLGNQADGQLGLCANGVEPRRVENDQALLEQRVGNVDQRVAPFRHFNQSVRADLRVIFGMVVVPKTQQTRIVNTHVTHLGNFLHGVCKLFRVIDVQINAGPFLGHHAPFHQRLAFQAGLDWQQPQARWNACVVAQLSRAHRGAPCARGHDAATITGEKDRVDQLRLAARKFRHKRDHHLVRAHLRLQAMQPLFHGRVEQVVILHPPGEQLEPQRELASPQAVLVKLIVEGHVLLGWS